MWKNQILNLSQKTFLQEQIYFRILKWPQQRTFWFPVNTIQQTRFSLLQSLKWLKQSSLTSRSLKLVTRIIYQLKERKKKFLKKLKKRMKSKMYSIEKMQSTITLVLKSLLEIRQKHCYVSSNLISCSNVKTLKSYGLGFRFWRFRFVTQMKKFQILRKELKSLKV